MTERPEFFRGQNGDKASLPFEVAEYEARIADLRARMDEIGATAAVPTSMHNIAYYSGFLYCAFGRPYGLIVTEDASVIISAGIDAGQPWRRSFCDTLTYTDWQQDKLEDYLEPEKMVDLYKTTMQQRMLKSPVEIALIREAIRAGAREIDVAMARRFPDAEYRDTWVWCKSGINTDGEHNPVNGRALEIGDILRLNTFPVISGYYTALERTLFVREVDPDSLKIWEANVATHQYGMSLLKPGVSCAVMTQQINTFLAERGLLQYRSFGYGHSFGVLSHYYRCEAGLELRKDIETVPEPGMVVSMEPMLTIPEGQPGAGGYREHDIFIISETGAENIKGYPYGPNFNIVG